MAQNEVKVKVSTETDTSDLDSLEDRLNGTHTFNIESPELANITEEIENQKQIIEELKLYGLDTSEAEAELQELETEFDNLNSSIGGSTGSVDELTSSLDSMAMLQVGEVLQSYGSSAEDLAQQMNEASITVGQLATQTGIAEPQMVNLINHISNATFPNDEAMMYVKSLDQIGVSSDRLGQSATDLDKINDAFGLGANTVNSLGQELSVLGVDMNNVSSSFNALAYANANTVGGMENYYSFLRKYDAQFNELGFNVDQASVIIAGATQKFGGGRAALTGLNEALEKSNGDTRALEEALGLEAGSIENATQLTGEYEGQLQALADEEAEHKTWLDQLGAAWEDFSLSMSGALEPFMSLFGLSGQLAGFGMQLNGTWELLSKFKDVSFFSKLRGAISGALSTIGGALSGVKTKVLDLASTIKTSLMGAFTSLKTTMTSTIIPALRNVATSLFNTGRAALTAGLNALKSAGMWLIEKAALVVTKGATLLMEAAQWLLNIAMNANPIMLIVTAILILIMVLGYLYFNNEQVRAAIDGLGQAFMQIGQIIYDSVVNAIKWLMTTLQNLWNYIVTLGGLLPENVSITGNRIVDTILRVLGFIATLPIQLGIILINTIAKVLGFGDNFVQNMIKAGSRAVTNFFIYISKIPGRLATELGNALNKVQEWAASLPQKFWEAGVNAVKNFLAALGIASPGTMQRMLVWEVSEMGRRVPEESRTLLSNVSDLGTNIVDSFGEPSLGLNYEDTMNSKLETVATTNDKTGGDIIFNMYGDMDTDERMNKFVDAVIRRLSFENTTAGRTA